jgi:hypothetical protein
VWPQAGHKTLAGTLSMRLDAPKSFDHTVPVTISWAGGRKSVDVKPGASVAVTVPACSSGRWLARISTTRPTLIGFRSVSLNATRPVFRPDAAACPNS